MSSICLVLTTLWPMPCHDTCLRQPSLCHLDSTSTTSSPHATCWGHWSDVIEAGKSQATPQHEQLHCEHAITLGYALDNSTLHTYNFHLQLFLTFCKLHSFPLDPTPETLSFFIVFMSHHIKPHLVMQYLSSIINSLKPSTMSGNIGNIYSSHVHSQA